MRSSSWELELGDLGRRVALLERALGGEPLPLDPDPWEPPAALGVSPTPEERKLFEELLSRLDACRAGVEQAARDLVSDTAEHQRRRAAVRRYALP